MRIICWHDAGIIPYFCRKLGKMSQNLLSAAVVIGALRVKRIPNVQLNMRCPPPRSFERIAMSCYLFVFVALRPMSTAMVTAGRSVHLTTLFPGQA